MARRRSRCQVCGHHRSAIRPPQIMASSERRRRAGAKEAVLSPAWRSSPLRHPSRHHGRIQHRRGHVREAKPGYIEVAFNGSRANVPLDAQFSVPANGVTAIFGAPGCGNATLARCIAGVQRLPSGFCAIDGEIWQDETTFRPPHLRPVAYVFQRPILFSHLSVKRALLYNASKSKPTLIDFDGVVELLGLGPLLDCSPSRLSGAERQRLALGNALLAQPRLLLLDDPLTMLDRSAKCEILPFLECMRGKAPTADDLYQP
ncbi:ABC-type thiamine transport system ATPase subunit [Bradyrhizobium sp. JR6.1]